MLKRKQGTEIKEKEIIREMVRRNGVYYTRLVKALEFILKGKTTKRDLLSYLSPTNSKK